MKLVKTAKIEVVTLLQLREGDEILWSSGKRIESGDFCDECITEHEMPFLLNL